jgi:hypothetical protein
MTSGGMRATSLSTVTKICAGQMLSSYHCARHWLYCLLATGVHSYPSVCHLFSFYFHVIVKLHQPIHEAQIYFVFLSVGNPKTVLKGGYVGRKGGSSFASLWFERWLVWACKCAYDCGQAVHINYLFVNSFAIISACFNTVSVASICMSGG